MGDDRFRVEFFVGSSALQRVRSARMFSARQSARRRLVSTSQTRRFRRFRRAGTRTVATGAAELEALRIFRRFGRERRLRNSDPFSCSSWSSRIRNEVAGKFFRTSCKRQRNRRVDLLRAEKAAEILPAADCVNSSAFNAHAARRELRLDQRKRQLRCARRPARLSSRRSIGTAADVCRTGLSGSEIFSRGSIGARGATALRARVRRLVPATSFRLGRRS